MRAAGEILNDDCRPINGPGVVRHRQVFSCDVRTLSVLVPNRGRHATDRRRRPTPAIVVRTDEMIVETSEIRQRIQFWKINVSILCPTVGYHPGLLSSGSPLETRSKLPLYMRQLKRPIVLYAEHNCRSLTEKRAMMGTRREANGRQADWRECLLGR